MATGSVAEVTAHLASWCERAPKGLALVEFDSEPARGRVVEDLRAHLTAAGFPFHELTLAADREPPEVVRELISELSSLDAGAISISGFEKAFPLGGSHEDMLAAFNFQRERLAEPSLRQIWWLPVRVADAFLRGAPDLYSWFIVRLHLTETIEPWPAARPPIESWIAEGSAAPPTSLDDARQRAAELAGRFERALEDPEKPVEGLAHELLEPAIRALEEAGAVREARELEHKLRQRARELGRPFPPRVFISYSHDSPEHMDRVLRLADRLRAEGVDARLDQYEVSPPLGWQLWMEDEIEAADFVLVVATETYERRRRGREEEGRGLGARFEGAIVSQKLYDKALDNENVIPAVFSSNERTHIPVFLRAVTCYDLGSEDGYESLYRRLTNQPRIRKPSLGRLRKLAPKDRRQRFAVGSIWNVPHRPNPFFTGREEELTALHDVLAKEGSAALGQAQAISGLGGVGKTQTAVEYANRHRNDYQAVLWIQAATEAGLVSGFSDVAAALDLPEKDARSQEATIKAVKRWLESKTSWLLVLDNADDPELVEPFLPVAHRGHILLTSRAWNLSRLNVARPLRLDVLKRDDAVRFLLDRTSRDDAGESERLAATELAAELGELPLALGQAAAYIHAQQCRFDDYLTSYRERRLRLLETGKPDSYPASVATTWALNFEEVERASAASAEILRLCAFLAPERIPVEILTLGAAELGPTLSTTLADVTEDPVVLDELLEPLSRYWLIERDPETRSFSIHRMVQEVVRAALDKEDHRLWAERVVRALSRVFPEVVEVSNWLHCERLLQQAMAALELVDRYANESQPAAGLFVRAGVYLFERGRYRQAAPLFERSLAIQEAVLGAEHPDVAMSLNNLARVHTAMGDYASARQLYDRSLAIVEKAFGRQHPTVAMTLNNLAALHFDQGKVAMAKQLTQRSLAVSEKALGREHPTVAATLNNLAECHRVQGAYASAEPLYKRSLEIRERALGPEHPDVAQSLNNLALLHDAQGDFASAAALLERSLSISEKVLGSEHPNVAFSLGNLAKGYHSQGNSASAAPLYERSLAILEKTLGPDHPHLGELLENYARFLEETERTEEAEDLKARSRAIRTAARDKA